MINVFNFLSNQDQPVHQVKVLHYTDWSGDLPGQMHDVIQLVDTIKSVQEKDKTSPVLIQCL